MEELKGKMKNSKKDMEGFKEVEQNEVVELKEEGSLVKGKFVSIEQSKLYEKSYAVKFKDISENDKIKVFFVNQVGADLITDHLKPEMEFILEHAGMRETVDKRAKYHTYKLHYKPGM